MADIGIEKLLGPEIPFRGLNSSACPAFLPPGKMAALSNVRVHLGAVQVRKACVYTGAAPPSPLPFRGLYECLFGGTPTLFTAATTISGPFHVNFFSCTNPVGAYSTISTGAGPYGATYFAQDARAEFQIIKDRVFGGRTAQDCIVIQNGLESPRIYAKGGGIGGAFDSSTLGMSVVQTIPAPAVGPKLQYSTAFKNFWLVNDPTQTTYPAPPATFPLADGSAVVGNNTLLGTLKSTYVALSGVACTCVFSSTLDLSTSRALVLAGVNYTDSSIGGVVTAASNASPIVVTTSAAHGLRNGDKVRNVAITGNTAANGDYTVTILTATTFALNGSQGNGAYVAGGVVQTPGLTDFWQNLGIVLTDNVGATLTVYDLSQEFNADFILQPNAQYLSTAQISYLLPSSTTFDFAHVKKISFTWLGSIVPDVDLIFQVCLLAGSGRFQGTSKFACSYYSADTRTMGPATPYPAVTQGTVNLSGGPDPIATATAWPLMQDDARFYFDYIFSYPSPPNFATTLTIPGIDRAILWSQYPGQTNLFFQGDQSAATYTASTWTTDKTNFSGAILPQDLSWTALDSAYSGIPTGSCMCASTQRLMVGAGDRFWYSGAERPFQFRQLVASDTNGVLLAESPGSFGVDGEVIQQFLDIGSLGAGQESVGQAQNGVSTVFILTDRSLSWVTGWDAISLNKRNRLYPRGSYAPKSLCASRGGFFFLDTDRRWVVVDGYSPRIVSRDIVDDILLGIPTSRIPWIWAAELNDRIYLCYTPNGGTTNTNALIYDAHESLRIGEHVFLEDTFPSTITGAGLVPLRNGSVTSLIGVDAGMKMFQHEAAGSNDQGQTGVTWSLTFPELKGDLWSSIRIRRVGVVADAAMGTITTTRAAVGRLSLATSVASIDTSTPTGSRAVKWDSPAAGLLSNSIVLTLSGASVSGKRLINVVAEVGPIAVDGPDA